MPGCPELNPGERGSQFKPRESVGGLADATERICARAEFHSPAATGGLRGRHGERIFGELDERIAVVARGDEEIAGKFGAAARRLPDGLALADVPAGLRQVSGAKRRDGAAGDCDENKNAK